MVGNEGKKGRSEHSGDENREEGSMLKEAMFDVKASTNAQNLNLGTVVHKSPSAMLRAIELILAEVAGPTLLIQLVVESVVAFERPVLSLSNNTHVDQGFSRLLR